MKIKTLRKLNILFEIGSLILVGGGAFSKITSKRIERGIKARLLINPYEKRDCD